MSVPSIRFEAPPLIFGYTANGGSWGSKYERSLEGLILSSSHHRLKNGGWSGGGPLFVVKDTWTSSGSFTVDYVVKATGSKESVTLVSSLLPSSNAAPSYPSWNSLQAGLSADYVKGYRITRPGNSVASAGQFFVELARDPLPSIPLQLLARLRNLRSVGHEYLNVVFGWKPLLNDIRKMVNLVMTIERRMNQIRNENGHGIRRRATIEDSNTVTSSVTQSIGSFLNCVSAPAGVFALGHSTYTVVTRTESKKWYAARYRYYIPDTDSSQWTRRAQLALFGALPTPELLWEVLPWSWLIDYFTNFGDVVSNASRNAVDNLTCDYSYTMHHVKVTTVMSTQTNYGPTSSVTGFRAGDATISATHVVERKCRQGSLNPYGLGFTIGSLTTYQSAVLAALGISRQRLL